MKYCRTIAARDSRLKSARCLIAVFLACAVSAQTPTFRGELLVLSSPYLREHHRLIPVEQHPILYMPPYTTGEHDFLQVTAFLQQVV